MARRAPALPLWNVDSTVLLADVAVDAQAVYLAGFPFDPGAPRLQAVARDRSGTRTLLPARHAPVSLVRADADGLFVVVPGAILEVDRVTGDTRRVAATLPAATVRLELAGAWLYGVPLGVSGVYRVPRAGGDLEWVALGRGMCVAADGERLAVVVDGQVRVRVGTGPFTELGAVHNPHRLAWVGDTLVAAEFAEAGALVAFDTATGSRRELAVGGYYSQVLAHQGWVYVTQALHKSGPWVFRVRVESGEVQPLVRGRSKGGRLAVGAGMLAWIGDSRGGAGALDLAALG